MSAAMVGFWILAALAVGAAVAVVANPNPVRSALFLVVTFCVQAVFYITLAAQFIAAVQVIVYAGAIMVLFLFVIMLLNLGAPQALRERGRIQKPVAAFLGVALLAVLGAAGALSAGLGPPRATSAFLEHGGEVEAIGRALFDPARAWLFPFELTSILLLIGVVGALVMAKRRL